MSEFKQKLDPNKTNWAMKKQVEKYRIIQIGEIETDVMYSWYEQYKGANLRAKEHSKPLLTTLDNGPLGPTLCDMWILVTELTMATKWYEAVKTPSEEDMRVYKIIDGALNPTEPPEITAALEKQRQELASRPQPGSINTDPAKNQKDPSDSEDKS